MTVAESLYQEWKRRLAELSRRGPDDPYEAHLREISRKGPEISDLPLRGRARSRCAESTT